VKVNASMNVLQKLEGGLWTLLHQQSRQKRLFRESR
jgi:hypothetical protein